MDPFTIAAVAQGVAGGVQFVKGLVQGGKAKKMAKNNIRPDYSIPDAVRDNQNLIEDEAGRGMSAQSVSLYRQSSDRQLSSGIDAILQGGGSVNNIASLYSAGQDGMTKLAMLDDEMRSRNIRALVAQNSTMGDYQDKEWEIDKWGPYADTAQAAAALKKQGSENLWKGVNTMVSAGTNVATGNQYQEQIDGVFGARQSQAPLPSRRGEDIPVQTVGRSASQRQVTPRRTAAQAVGDRYPGLSGRSGGFANMDPYYDEGLGAWVDPYSGQRIN